MSPSLPLCPVQFEESECFTVNTNTYLGRVRMHQRVLAAHGWDVVTIPIFAWEKKATLVQKRSFLYVLCTVYCIYCIYCIYIIHQNCIYIIHQN